MIAHFLQSTWWLWLFVYLAGTYVYFGDITSEKWRDGGDPSDARRALAWPGFFVFWFGNLLCEAIKDMLSFALLALGIKLK